ncbi:HtaA domain-containing protein [Kitasatospora azatica]|uniref:HtaA domain-containing protein n=1 Tax=Kitasatospora azatica TaxID=58347 RepID=UPI00055E38A4|nr:HtaA domain-containing protein [Kitasatospora azatica]
MRIFSSKKRVVLLGLASATVVGLGAIQAGAVTFDLPVRGTGTQCLTPEADRSLAAQNVTLEPIAPATVTNNCLTYPGSGTLSPRLTGGEIPIQGGMSFSGGGHRLDLSNLVVHIRLGEGYTSADVSQDGAPATNIHLLTFPVSPSRVEFTPTTVDTKDIPLRLSAPAAAAFTDAFGESPVEVGETLFTFAGHAEITNPLGGFPTP